MIHSERKTENIFDILSGSPLFHGLDSLRLQKLFENKTYQIKHYNKNEYVALCNDSCEKLMILISGSVRGEMTDFSGKIIKIEDIHAPFPIAAAFVFGKNNRIPVDIIVNEPTTIMVIPKDVLLRLLQTELNFLKNFLEVISNRAQFLSQKISFLSFKTIKGKIAYYLLDLAGNERMTLSLPVSYTNLAAVFGVTRPSLARAFKELENENLIRIRQKEIYILDKEKLRILLG